MNNHRKYKKKKTALPSFTPSNPTPDEEQLATQNLFNISNSWDDPQEIHLHPETPIFILNHSQLIPYSKNNQIPTQNNYSQSSKKYSHYQTKQIENIIDKQFINESKNLLKLYAAPQKQPLLHQSNSFKSKLNDTLSKDLKNSKQSNMKLICSSFKSDSVFVVKKRISPQKTQIQKSKKRLQELKSTRKQHKNLQKDNQIFINTQQSCYFTPNRNYFHGNKRKTPQTKSLSQAKHKTLEYDSIEDVKTLNRMKWILLKNNMENNQDSIRLTPDKQVRNFALTEQIFNNSHNKPEQRQKNNSFRKRFNFFKNQRTKKQMKFTM